MLSRYAKLLLAIFTFMLIEGCVSKVYPDDRLALDPEFLAIFNSLSRKDSFSFRDKTGNRKVFIITKVDSVIRNKKALVMNERPYKLLRMNFREAGRDTVDLYRENEIFVNKYPDNNTSSIVIKFNNLLFDDTIPPPLQHDTLNLNGKKITNYYLFETSLGLKKPNDVKTLYINVPKGFVGFKTFSEEVWVNEVE